MSPAIVDGRSSGVPSQTKGMVCPSAIRLSAGSQKRIWYSAKSSKSDPQWVMSPCSRKVGQPSPFSQCACSASSDLRSRVTVSKVIPEISNFLPQTGLAGADDGLRPICYLQFAENVGDVVADGFGAEVEAFGDLEVLVALGDEVEDLALAVAELGEDLRLGSGTDTGEVVHEPDGDLRAEDGLSVADGPYGP